MTPSLPDALGVYISLLAGVQHEASGRLRLRHGRDVERAK